MPTAHPNARPCHSHDRIEAANINADHRSEARGWVPLLRRRIIGRIRAMGTTSRGCCGAVDLAPRRDRAEQVRKGASQRLADRIAEPLVPTIMIAATVIALVGSVFGNVATWIERALVVLVAASPCALAISVPVTLLAAIGAASRLGVLVKGGAALEALGAVRTVALDNTGTLTANRPAVIDVVPTNGATRDQVLDIAAALENRSEHPLARAVLAAAHQVTPASGVQAVLGAGLIGHRDGHGVRLGQPGWIATGPLAAQVGRMQEAGATAVLVEDDDTLIGAIAVRDELRPEARPVVEQLCRDGYRVVMLTGVNRATGRRAGGAGRHRRGACRAAARGQGDADQAPARPVRHGDGR